MKATTDMVLTRDRTRVVPLGDPEGDPLAWVASKGEEIPIGVDLEKEEYPATKKKAPAENKQRRPKEDK